MQHVDGERVGRDVLQRHEAIVQEDHPREEPHVVGDVALEDHREQREAGAELGEQHPRPAPAHRWKFEAVHQRPGQQLEHPGQYDNGEGGADIRGADPLADQPGRNRNTQQTVGDALRKIHHRPGQVANTGAV